MADLAQAVVTQLANIEKRTGKTLAELAAIINSSGLQKHSELVAMLKNDLGMGHGGRQHFSAYSQTDGWTKCRRVGWAER